MQESKLIHVILCLYIKALTLYNVMVLMKSVFNKDQNHYYYNVFLEKCSNQLAEK